MSHVSAQEMFDHLSTLVSDEADILRAVRAVFPDFTPSRVEMDKRAQTRAISAGDETYINRTGREIHEKNSIATGSRNLHLALWKHHPRIMERLKATLPEVRAS